MNVNYRKNLLLSIYKKGVAEISFQILLNLTYTCHFTTSKEIGKYRGPCGHQSIKKAVVNWPFFTSAEAQCSGSPCYPNMCQSDIMGGGINYADLYFDLWFLRSYVVVSPPKIL